MNVRWGGDALDDLDDIHRYIDQFDPAAADRVLAAIERSVERLADFAMLGSATRHRGVRTLSVPRYRYLVYHRPDEDLLVLRVVHARRLQ